MEGRRQLKTIYLNQRAWRVRIAQATLWLGAALCLWLVLSRPLIPTDGSVDQLVASLGAAFMLCAIIAFEVYLRLYVLRIDKDHDTLVITTLATVHHRRVRIPVTGLSLGQIRRERAPAALAPGYDNSWRALKVKGQTFPFIVDVTAPASLEL